MSPLDQVVVAMVQGMGGGGIVCKILGETLNNSCDDIFIMPGDILVSTKAQLGFSMPLFSPTFFVF